MLDTKQYELKRRHKLSPEMFLALCYIAQDHDFRGYTHGKTLSALRRRRFVDREHELTRAGWECYIELTNVGPCGTSCTNGWKVKDPHSQYADAKPRLDAIASEKANRERSRKPVSSHQIETASQEPRAAIFRVEDVKYGGRLIVLEDGSRWEVDKTDSAVSKSWAEMDCVVIIDNEMYRLDELQRVQVEREY